MGNQGPPGYPPQPPPPGGYGGPPPGYGYGPPPSGYNQYGQPYWQPPHPPAPPPVPPIHGSAQLALGAGISALLFLGITGIPAILLGYRALRIIDALPQPSAVRGKTQAEVSIVLGVLGSVLGGFVLGRRMGASSVGLGIAAVVVGFGAVAAFARMMKKLSWRVPQVLALCVWPSFIVIGGFVGIVGARAEEAERDALCTKSKAEITSYLTAKNFGAAHTALGVAQANCDHSQDATLAEMDRNVSQQEKAAEKAAADKAAADQAAAAAAKEKAAVQTFPQKSSEIAATYKRAVNDSYAGKWSDADTDLSSAEAELATFGGTTVASSKPYQDLSGQLAAFRKKVDAQLEAMAERKAARDEAAQAAQDDQNLRDLLAQYKDNEVRADAVYKGKVVEVGGIIGDIKKDITDTIYVTLGTGEWLQIPQVQCFFPDSRASETARLSSGRHVRMRGTVKGLMMNVLVQDCDLVK